MEFDQTQLIGAHLNAIFLVDGTPWNMFGNVVSVHPFAFETANAAAKNLEPGNRALFVQQEGEEIRKASSRVAMVRQLTDTWIIETDNLLWESIDRRRHERHEATVPVIYRTVEETEGDTRIERSEATTIDLSTGGACLSCPTPPPNGSLIDLGLVLGSGASSRALGIVAWSRPASAEFGVEFLDFIGDTRNAINSFLSMAA